MDGRSAVRERVAGVGEGRDRLPDDGESIIGEPGEGVLVADQREHRLAAVAHDAGGEHRLILDVRVDAEAVDPGDIGGGEDAGEPGIMVVERGAVPEGEARMCVRGTHDAQPERAGGHAVRAEDGPPRDLGGTVHAREPAAHVAHCARVFRGGARAHPILAGGRQRIGIPYPKTT